MIIAVMNTQLICHEDEKNMKFVGRDCFGTSRYSMVIEDVDYYTRLQKTKMRYRLSE